MAGTLKELKDEGKIRAIGASNLSFRQLQEFNADGYLEVFQSEYSLIQREAEHDLLPYCEKNGISFIPYFPLASGLLTESLQKTQSLRTAERTGRRFREKLFTKIWSEWISFGPLRRKRGADSAYRTRMASVAAGGGCDHSRSQTPRPAETQSGRA